MALFVRLLAASLVCVSGSALASVACFQPSPRFAAQGDAYWQINPLVNGPIAGKQALLKQLEPWQGALMAHCAVKTAAEPKANPR